MTAGEGQKPLTLNLTRIADDADALPLKIKFSIELEPDNPKRDLIWHAMGRFLAEILTPEEAQDLLQQWEQQLKRGEDVKDAKAV
jgi:hypothetical protein